MPFNYTNYYFNNSSHNSLIMHEIDIENEYLFLLENVGQICRVCLDLNQNNQCIFPASDNDPENTNALGLVKKLIVQGGIEVCISFYYLSFYFKGNKISQKGQMKILPLKLNFANLVNISCFVTKETKKFSTSLCFHSSLNNSVLPQVRESKICCRAIRKKCGIFI